MNRDYYSKEFKIINIIILRKLRKNNYVKLKLYRSIALLNTLKRILKKIIAKRLSDYVKENILLSSK